MKNRGFTLVELIAIIAVLSTIFLVSLPYLLNVTKDDDEKKYNDMVKNLCLSGESYLYANNEIFPELSMQNSQIEIKINQLIEYGNVDKRLENPKTNKNVKDDSLIYTVLSDLSLDCKYKD